MFSVAYFRCMLKMMILFCPFYSNAKKPKGTSFRLFVNPLSIFAFIAVSRSFPLTFDLSTGQLTGKTPRIRG